MYYKIGIPRDLRNIYTYSFEDKLQPGQLVSIDFRNRDEVGVIINSGERDFSGKIKGISSILPYCIRSEYIKFAHFVSNYNITSFGNILKLIVPFSVEKLLSPEKEIKNIISNETKSIILNEEQSNAVQTMSNFRENFNVILLHGITGSGKTEVFLEFIKKTVPSDKQVLILVPEVALSTELAKKVASRLNKDVYIWHNSISPAKKLAIWKKAVNGERLIIVGARSALFTPFLNLGCIIVDEEHDNSFKQSEGITYNARDMAVYLGSVLNIPVVLSSATPSIESYNNALSKKYKYIRLNSRCFENVSLPSIYIDDLKKYKLNGALSDYSIHEIEECLHQKKQILIFVNRRGHSPKVLCSSCGWKINCPGCSSWLCYHSENNSLVCHYCGFKTKLKVKCESCGNNTLIGIGTGIEKVEEEVKQLFPNSRILTLSSDTIDTPNKIAKALEKIKNLEVDIILGTQIIAKGHNFNNLNLVIVTCVDSMLYGDDFRATEKAFQILHQVSGRAGRVDPENSAKVIIQTYNPHDELMRILETNDVEKFYQNEINNRKLLKMPPFGKMISIIISALSEREVFNFAKEFVKKSPINKNVKIMGPIQPAIFKLRSRYRLRILIISPNKLQDYIEKWKNQIKVPSNIQLNIDVDPYDFM